jgi:hypothetical protein
MKRLGLIVAAAVAFAPTMSLASTASIEVSPGHGIDITHAMPNAPVFATNVSNGVTFSGNTTAGGEFSAGPGSEDPGRSIFQVSIGPDHWYNLAPGPNENVISLEEGISNFIKNLISSISSFLSSNDKFMPAPGNRLHYNTFDLNNTGANDYYLTDLKLYTGLDLTYYNQTNFYSSTAIATGSLYDDVTGRLGTEIIPAGSGFLLSVDAVPDQTYSLLMATVEEVLPSGQIGPPELVAIGGAVGVPEPSTWTTLVVGFFFLGGILRWRRQSPRTMGPY